MVLEVMLLEIVQVVVLVVQVVVQVDMVVAQIITQPLLGTMAEMEPPPPGGTPLPQQAREVASP